MTEQESLQHVHHVFCRAGCRLVCAFFGPWRRPVHAAGAQPVSPMTTAEALERLRAGTLYLHQIPAALRTAKVCLTAVRRDGAAAKSVPAPVCAEVFTPEVCLAIVQKHCYDLAHIPETFRSEAACLMAVGRDGMLLREVPSWLRTPGFLLAAARLNGFILKRVPDEKQTPALCQAAVTQNGLSLQYMPEARRTPELCQLAVAQNGAALEYVPPPICTPALCLTAMQQNRQAWCYIPQALRNLVEVAEAYELRPEWLRAAQVGDTLAVALDRLAPGLDTHLEFLQNLALTGDALHAGLQAFLEPAASAMIVPELEP